MSYNCSICNKKYKSYQSIWNHNNKYHTNINTIIQPIDNKIRNFNCSKCDKKFTRKGTMLYHLSTACKNKDTNNSNNKILELKNQQTKIQKKTVLLENNKGFIYCLYNPTFKTYGDNVYKLGKTKNLSNRMYAYTTSYVDKSEYILTSVELDNRNTAEKLLFKELEKYRVSINREFFNCDIKIIKETFEKVERFFNGVNNIKISTKKHIGDSICTKCNENFTKENNMILHINKNCKDEVDPNVILQQQIMELQKEIKEYKEQLLANTINTKFTHDCKKIFKEMLKQQNILSYNDREVVETTMDNSNIKDTVPSTFEEDIFIEAEDNSDSDSELESKLKNLFNKNKIVKPKELVV